MFPGVLIENFRDWSVSAGIINFVAFLTAKRKLFFSSDSKDQSISGVGVP